MNRIQLARRKLLLVVAILILLTSVGAICKGGGGYSPAESPNATPDGSAAAPR